MRRCFDGVACSRLPALATALLVAGCAAVGPDFKRPEVTSLADWSGGSLTALAEEQRDKPRA